MHLVCRAVTQAISLIHLKLGDIGTSVPLLERALAKEIEVSGFMEE